MKTEMSGYLLKSDVHLCFDRYHEYSIKGSARMASCTASRGYLLTVNTPMLSRKLLLNNYSNKMQLNSLIIHEILGDSSYLTDATQLHTIVVKGNDPVPTAVSKGHKSTRLDLYSVHEEPDSLIVQQAMASAANPVSCTVVLADDTDIFDPLYF